MNYFIKTYGCQMNYSDSERIASILEMKGYKKTLLEDNADLIIINACSVRQSAIDKISGRFKKYKRFRKTNPGLKIVLTGCILKSDKKKFEKMFDLIIGIKEIEQILIKLSKTCYCERDTTKAIPIQHAKDLITGLSRSVPLLLHSARNDNNYFKIKPLRQNKLSAYVPIMTGCNNFCSYCVVPYTRGREYSRPAEKIIDEIKSLIKQGYKEIILLGQNVNSYQSKIHKAKSQKHALSFLRRQKSTATLNVPKHAIFYNKTNSANWIPAFAGTTENTETITFPRLLKLINAIPGIFRIRFLTSHPKDMSEELIKTVAERKKVTPYIHLALQSGNDEILKKMNRKYTAGHFLKLVKMIRKYLPDAAISTDIIIGFPGETEKQFLDTIEIMKKAKFDMAYLNKYSPRAGTAAAKLDNNISWAKKKQREKILTDVLRKTALENNKKYIGKVVEVLVDELGIKNYESGIIFGKTRSFKNVKIDIGSIVPLGLWNQNADGLHKAKATIEPTNLVGKFLNIKITQADAWGLEGKIVKQKKDGD